jgi:stringent starvation protein B
MNPTRLPPKRDVMLALLDQASVFLHLDPRRSGVTVPEGFKGQPQLVLQLGWNMTPPISDLSVEEAGVSGTLSFNRLPFWCQVPWAAVYALVGGNGQGMVWPDDVPPEVNVQVRRPQEAPPHLRAVGAKEAAPAPPEPARVVKRETAKKPRRRKAAESRESMARSLAQPEKAAPVSSPTKEAPSVPELAVTPEPKQAEASSGQAQAGAKPKRQLPPYLRIVK